MDQGKKYFKQISHYFSGHILVRAFGLISMPILTRVLDVSEYGILGLVTSTIMIGVLISKLGLQQSVIRFYPEFKFDDEEKSASVFYSTFFSAGLVMGIIGSVIFFFITQTIISEMLGHQAVRILSFAWILIGMGCTSAFLTIFLRAEQKTKLYNLLVVGIRIGSFFFSFFFLFYVFKGLTGYFIGSVLSAGLATILLVRIVLAGKEVSLKKFSLPLLKKAIMYGFPLTILEISHSILNFGDRYVIKYYLNAHELGLYSAAYTIAMEVIEVIDYPILSTVPVLYFELWNREGREGVQNLLRKGLKYYSLVVIPVMFGVIALSKELIIIIASNKYAGSAEIVPYITIGGVIFTSSTFFSAGLYIYKKSIIPSFIMMISASINMVLNFILVPRYGLIGSAVATLIGYTSYVIIIIPISFKYVSYRPDFKAMARYASYAVVMFISINEIHILNPFSSLVVKISIGILIYSGFVLLLEREIREVVLKYFFPNRKKYQV